MGSLAKTHQHIADILSYKTSTDKLEKRLKNSNIDWDAIVIEGSKHLVLPAIYCRLKAKQILNVLPEELNNYLESITEINRNRNISIIKQVKTLSKLLNAHTINHVFIKGSALITAEYYDDIAERMVGDIDILVEKHQVEDAFNIIKSNDYNDTIGFAYKTKDFRHLDRLISKNEIAAVEIHSELLNKKSRKLIDLKKFLDSKVLKNEISIPTKKQSNFSSNSRMAN